MAKKLPVKNPRESELMDLFKELMAGKEVSSDSGPKLDQLLSDCVIQLKEFNLRVINLMPEEAVTEVTKGIEEILGVRASDPSGKEYNKRSFLQFSNLTHEWVPALTALIFKSATRSPEKEFPDAKIVSDTLLDALSSPTNFSSTQKAFKATLKQITFPNGDLNVKIIREKLGLSQSQFAKTYLINLETLQSWEAKKYAPKGAVYNYLLMVAFRPEAVHEVMQFSTLKK